MSFLQEALKWFFLFELCIQFYIQLYFIFDFINNDTSLLIFFEYVFSLLVYHDILLLVIVLILDSYLIYINQGNCLFVIFCIEFMIKNIVRWVFYNYLLEKDRNGYQKMVCFLLEKKKENENLEENLLV